MKKITFFTIIALLLVSISITSISAQNQYEIPSWVKGVAGFWAEGKISDGDFGEGLAFLIDNEIIKVPKIQDLQNKISQLQYENANLRSQLNLSIPEDILGPEDCTSNQVWQNQACVDATKPNTVTPMTTLKLNSLGKLTIDEGKSLSFAVKVIDKSLNGLVFNLDKNPPTGAKINPSTGMFTWTPDDTQGAKSYVFDIVVTLGSLTDKQSIIITVNDVLNTPKPNTVLGPEDCTPNQVWQNQACVDATTPPKNDLNLQTNLDLYRQGDVVVITGLIHNIENLSTSDVAIIGRGPDNNNFLVAQVHPNADGSFQTSFKADGPQFIAAGDYTVLANFAGLKSQITFEFTGGNGAIVSGGDSQSTTCPSDQTLINGKCFASISISVITDKIYYKYGDIIKISGQVREILSDPVRYPVSLRVTDPNGHLVTIAQIDVGSDKKFSIELTAGGELMRDTGTYTIKVLYGSEARTAQTTFTFSSLTSGDSQTCPSGQTLINGKCVFPITISVTTDKSKYNEGDIILVSGKVSDLLSEFIPVTLMVIAPNGETVNIEQFDVGSDKKFSMEIITGGAMKSAGTYTVKVSYGGDTTSLAKTTFTFSGSTGTIPKNNLNLQTDKALYQQGDVVVITGLIHNIENFSTTLDVAIIVRAADNNIVTMAQAHPNADGSFQISLKADGQQFITAGNYAVFANFSGLKSEITFKFTQ